MDGNKFHFRSDAVCEGAAAHSRAHERAPFRASSEADRPARAAWSALRLLVDVVIFVLVLHRALPDLAADETLLLCGRVVGTEVGIPFGAIKPEF
jgi:hypothetical protein